MSDPMNENPEHARARKQRNLVLALALAALVVLTFVVSLIKMSQTGHVGPTF